MRAAIIDLDARVPLNKIITQCWFMTFFYLVAPKGAVCFQTKETSFGGQNSAMSASKLSKGSPG